MEVKMLRAAIIGASTLLGREVAEQLAVDASTTWTVALFDDPVKAGQLTTVGEEAAIVQAMQPGALRDLDVVFFAGDIVNSKVHAQEARVHGALIVDLSGCLEAAEDTAILSFLSPALKERHDQSKVIVPAHPVAVMLATVGQRLADTFGVTRLVATVHQPASQHGKEAVDELQAQTTALLSFQQVPNQIYDAQTAFALLPKLGADAKFSLSNDAAQIRSHFKALASDVELELLLLQAPVFYGFAASVFIELRAPATHAEVQKALSGSYVNLVMNDGQATGSDMTIGSSDILVDVLGGSDGEPRISWWVWLSADNIQLAARSAIVSASGLLGATSTGNKARGVAIN